MERCVAAGMNGYVSKPVNAEGLLAVVQAVLERPRMACENAAPAKR
jgi:CheY-like chemotaxis protein